jgi:GT2 family glycosyltransferase
MANPKIAIGIPCMGSLPVEFFNSFIALRKPPATATVMSDAKPLDLARERIVEAALQYGADYLLFLDSDTLPPADALEKMLSRGGDIVGGLYFQRFPPFKPLLLRANDKGTYNYVWEWPENSVVEVDATGLGCVLIKTDVFKKIERPWFQFGTFPDGRPLSEDYYFCKKARAAGYKILVDTSIHAVHLGSIKIDYNFWKNNVVVEKE